MNEYVNCTQHHDALSSAFREETRVVQKLSPVSVDKPDMV
nr:hypothetical protein 220p1_00046 [Serratia entomophila]